MAIDFVRFSADLEHHACDSSKAKRPTGPQDVFQYSRAIPSNALALFVQRIRWNSDLRSNLGGSFELLSVVGVPSAARPRRTKKRSVQMRSNRMLMGAAVIGCLAAAMTSGAHAQETNMKEQLNARTGHQPAASARASGSIRQGQSADMNTQLNARTGGNAQLNARTNSDATPANGQFERRGLANESRMGAQRRVGASAREGRGYAEQRALLGEHGAFAREQRYGRGGGAVACTLVPALRAVIAAVAWPIGNAPSAPEWA
jgi:hypothetical protein